MSILLQKCLKESKVYCNLLYTRRQKKQYDSEIEAFSSTSNISAKSLSNLQAKVSFGILRTS